MAEDGDRRIRELFESASQAFAGGRVQDAERLMRQAEADAPRHPLVQNEIAAKELTVPWEMQVPGAKDYYFVVPEQKQSSPAIRVFRDWLLEASKQYRGELNELANDVRDREVRKVKQSA